MLTSNMSGGSCAATRLTSWLASPGVRAMTRTLRPKLPMSLGSMSPRPRRPLCCAWTKSLRSWFHGIDRLERLEAAIGDPLRGTKLFAKRDDLMGLGGGGNKLRKLKFLLGEAVAKGADTIITVGGR